MITHKDFFTAPMSTLETHTNPNQSLKPVPQTKMALASKMRFVR